MKKICSLMLALIMIFATFAVISIPTAAADGQWSVYTAKSQYLEEFTGLPHNYPGYKYVKDEGLQVTSGVNPNSTPFVTIQTTEKVDLKLGVYMQVRVDNFSYSGYTWFGFHIWDRENVEPGKLGEEHGYGAEALMRVVGGDPDNTDKNLWPGHTNALQWYTDFEEGHRDTMAVEYATSNKNEDARNDRFYATDFNTYDENKNPILTLEIKWTGFGFDITINGAPAPAEFAQGIYDFFKGDQDLQAHIGFSMQSPEVGGIAEATVLKFGTSEADATTPAGGDSREVEVVEIEYAEIANASTVKEGQPAIILDGSVDYDSKGKPSAYNGNTMSVTEEGFVNVTANSDGIATATFRLKDEVSFDAKDFPIVLIITRNFCTCTYEVGDDYKEIEVCACGERISTKALAGDIMEPDTARDFYTKIDEYGQEGKKYVKNYTDEAGNSYLSMMTDWQNLDLLVMRDGTSKVMEGRIHGVRLDITGVKIAEPGRSNFDICQVAFFRNEADAEAYAKSYIAEIAQIEIPEDETVENVTEDETETTVETEAETGTQAETTIESETTVETTVETTPETTTTSDEENKGDQNVNVNVGCGGTVGFSAIAIVALAGAGLLTFRKKED